MKTSWFRRRVAFLLSKIRRDHGHAEVDNQAQAVGGEYCPFQMVSDLLLNDFCLAWNAALTYLAEVSQLLNHLNEAELF